MPAEEPFQGFWNLGTGYTRFLTEPEMNVPALSIAGLSQYVALTSNASASQKAWQSLAQSLANSNLVAAQAAFDTYQQLTKDQAATSTDQNAQFSTDMTALGKALASGDITQAQQAFATVKNDLNGAPSPAVQNAESAVAQTVSWVNELLGFNDSSSAGSTTTASTTVDPAMEILASSLGLNLSQTKTDPTVALLETKYGVDALQNSGSNSSGAASSGNSGSSASVNVYA